MLSSTFDPEPICEDHANDLTSATNFYGGIVLDNMRERRKGMEAEQGIKIKYVPRRKDVKQLKEYN